LKMYKEGTLPWGTNERLGIAEEGVGLALNKYYEEYTPPEIKEKMAEVIEKVTSGEIEVETVF